MIKFIKASEVKSKKEKINTVKLINFIKLFNKKIKNVKLEIDDSYYLNDIIDPIGTLNETEFKKLVALANESGWILTRFDDNCQAITYSFKKI
jgi:hypothetical protein